jgi:hypothetical protein
VVKTELNRLLCDVRHRQGASLQDGPRAVPDTRPGRVYVP